MSELSLEEDPFPSGIEKRYLWDTCHFLDSQCNDELASMSSGLWTGVDLPPMDIAELTAWLSVGDETYAGPFMEFCERAVKTKKYKRFGDGAEPLNLRLKVVRALDDTASITILLQQEYVGYDVFIYDGNVVLKTTGRKEIILEGDEAIDVIDDVAYVGSRMIERAYELNSHPVTIETCDLPAPSATSKESASRPRQNFGRRALQLLKI